MFCKAQFEKHCYEGKLHKCINISQNYFEMLYFLLKNLFMFNRLVRFYYQMHQKEVSNISKNDKFSQKRKWRLFQSAFCVWHLSPSIVIPLPPLLRHRRRHHRRHLRRRRKDVQSRSVRNLGTNEILRYSSRVFLNLLGFKARLKTHFLSYCFGIKNKVLSQHLCVPIYT